MKKLFIHIGFPRTGTTTLQLHLFPKHSQINYLGRTPRNQPKITLIELVCNLNDNDFNQIYEELLDMCSNFRLENNKTNILSSEFIISFATHYNNGLDLNHNVCRSLKRLERLFKDINIDVEFFCSIRNQATIIPSFYVATSPELKKSMKYNSEDIIDNIKKNKIDNFKIRNLLNGYKYWELHKNFNIAFEGKKKLKYFIYEEYQTKFPSSISKYLSIDANITKELINGRIENSSKAVLNEHPLLNSKFSIIYNKMAKNFSYPKILFQKFDRKIINLYFLLKDLILKNKKRKNNDDFTNQKKNFCYKLDHLKKNSELIKKFYREDNLKLIDDLNIDVSKYDYL